MKARSIAVVLSLLALCPVFAQEKPKEPAASAMGGPEMEAMMKAMQPGENHKHLAWYAGDWTFTQKMWMDPSQPPAESSGTNLTAQVALGRYRSQPNRTGLPAGTLSPKRETVAAPRYSSSTLKSFSRPAVGTTTTVSPTAPCEAERRAIPSRPTTRHRPAGPSTRSASGVVSDRPTGQSFGLRQS